MLVEYKHTNHDPAHFANVNPMKYRSYYYDAEIDMYYLQSRYYWLPLCRFLNADLPDYARIQKNETAGINLFAYCNNDPVNNADPTGNYSKKSVYILYDYELYKTQAKHEKKKWEAKDGSYKVIKEPIKNKEDLINHFNKIPENSIIILIFHGWPYGISIHKTYFEEEDVKKLKNKKNKSLYIYACNCGHKDVKNNIAKRIKKHLTKTKKVFAMDGSISYYPVFHYNEYKYYKPRLSTNQSSYYKYAKTIWTKTADHRWIFYFRSPCGLYSVGD